MTLDGEARTEAALEALFGLPDTTAVDPLRVPPSAQLVTWQLAGLTGALAGRTSTPARRMRSSPWPIPT